MRTPSVTSDHTATRWGSGILASYWWAIAVRGLLGVAVGLLAFVMPVATIVALVWLFGAYALLDGLFNLFTAWRGTARSPWWALMLSGVAGVGAGIVSFLWPGLTALAFVYLIAAWAFMTGALAVAAAVRLRREITGEWLLALAGALSIFFGGLLALFPTVGAVTLVWMFGLYAVIFGVVTIALGLRLRSRVEAQEDRTRLAA